VLSGCVDPEPVEVWLTLEVLLAVAVAVAEEPVPCVVDEAAVDCWTDTDCVVDCVVPCDA